MCERCNGTGYITVYDWVPYGSGDVQMPSGEACPSCLERDTCPRCGEFSIIYAEAPKRAGKFVYDDTAVCLACGWDDSAV
jgi:hypothetical protein